MELKLLVLLSSLTVVDAESEVIGSHEAVTVTVGQDAILPCHLEPPIDVTTLTVQWEQNGKEVHLYRSMDDYLVDQDENFKDRTFLFHDEMIKGNISLKLTKVTELDAGRYTCFVPKLQSQIKRGCVNLIVDPDPDSAQDGDTGIVPGSITEFLIGIVTVIFLAAGFAGRLGNLRRRRQERRNNMQNMQQPSITPGSLTDYRMVK